MITTAAPRKQDTPSAGNGIPIPTLIAYSTLDDAVKRMGIARDTQERRYWESLAVERLDTFFGLKGNGNETKTVRDLMLSRDYTGARKVLQASPEHADQVRGLMALESLKDADRMGFALVYSQVAHLRRGLEPVDISQQP